MVDVDEGRTGAKRKFGVVIYGLRVQVIGARAFLVDKDLHHIMSTTNAKP